MTDNSRMTKAQRRDAARAEALALQERQRRRDQRNRWIVLGVLALAVVAVVVAVVIILQQGSRNDVEDVPLADVETVPAVAQEDGGIPVGADGAAGTTNEGAPTIDVYLDYMCPICGQFEQVNAADIEELVGAGEATVVYHPVAILDHLSQGAEYSTRAASAAAWVADRAPEAFTEFHDALFTNQPAEGTQGLTDDELASFAEDAGVPADVAGGIADGTARTTFGQWVYSATNAATSDPDLEGEQGFGTPTVLLDGERFTDWGQPGALRAAVGSAAG